MLKNFVVRIFLSLIIFVIIVIFLWLCPPVAGKYKFNIILFVFAILCFFYGLVSSDITISGLVITIGNGLTRFSLVSYPTVSFLNCWLFLGYVLSLKQNDKNLFIQNSGNNKGVIHLVIVFWLINLLSAFFHILILNKPGVVFVVNRAGMRNIEIVYHIVGYILLPLTCGILLFLLMLTIIDEKKEENFLTYLAIGCFISSIIGILQAIGVIKGIFGYITPWEPRVNGLFSDFNSFSLSVGLFLPIFYFYFFRTKSISKKVLYFLTIILGVVNLFLTGTRSGILVFGLTIILWLFVLLLKRKYRQVLLLIVYFLVLFLLVKILSYQKNRFYGIQRLFSYFSTNIVGQIQERKIYWKTGIKVWEKNILTGNGIKSVYKEFSNINPQWVVSDNACNTYIHYAAEIGVVGLVVFISIIMLTLFFTKNNILRVVTLSFVIALFFGHHIESEEVCLIFWSYLGIMSKTIQIKDGVVKVVKLLSFSLLVFFLVVSVFSFVKNYTNLDIFKYDTFVGLYKPEKLNDKQFFWTDKFVLVKVGDMGNKEINLEFNSGDIKNQRIKIFVDNKKYKEIELPENRWVPETLIIPQDCKILKIVPEKIFIPAGKTIRYVFPFSGKDYRRLGVMLSFK